MATKFQFSHPVLDLYFLVNEKSSTVAELWDGNVLKCTFRMSVDDRPFALWEEVVQLARTIVFCDDPDSLVWLFISTGVYSSRSLYGIINFRGVLPVYEPAVWKLNIPPRVQIFFYGFSLKTDCLLEIMSIKGNKWMILLACSVVN